MSPLAAIAAAAGAAVGAYAAVRRALTRVMRVPRALVQHPTDDTRIDDDGAVRSVQGADIVVPLETLAEMWNPLHLERLARTYWRFLSRCTLGLIRVEYTDAERFVVFLGRPFVLLSFHAPEYEMNAERGIVRWRIKSGILVARRGAHGDGYLEIDVRALPCAEPGMGRIHVEVEVANFYPAIAHSLSRWLYTHTQSRIHVLVTYGFLRSLAKRDLDESVVGRFAIPSIDDVGEPHAERRDREQTTADVSSA
jgi:hypothetical protein